MFLAKADCKLRVVQNVMMIMNAKTKPTMPTAIVVEPEPAKRKRGRPSIKDEFADLPVSRQRKWQLRQMARGGCRICGQPASSTGLCLKHLVQERDYTAKRFAYKRKNQFCKSRLLEKLAQVSASTQWRYQIVSARAAGLDVTADSQALLVRQWGALGWEMTTVVPQPDGDLLFYFKQPVQAIEAFAT